MRAMILAAGRGERMRPLTDTCPKPLLRAGGQALIVWHLRRLVGAGITDIVINHAWLGSQIEQALGDGGAWGARLQYSPESPALETAGGIARALPLLGAAPFLVINGDIWCDWDPGRAAALAARMGPGIQGHLVLVPNPPHHPHGDFSLDADGRLAERGHGGGDGASLTFAGIGLYRPGFFEGVDDNAPAPLAPLLHQAIQARALSGERHTGAWVDVGTPQRLRALDAWLGGGIRSQAAGDAPGEGC